MDPLVYEHDNCFLCPIRANDRTIKVGDIVSCEVQPDGRYFCHLVWSREEYTLWNGVKKTAYIIGNNKPGDKAKSNGWCFREDLYGVVYKVQGRDYKPQHRHWDHQNDDVPASSSSSAK